MKKVLVVFLVVFLAGCSSMNSSFDCPNQPGVMCRDLDQVNTMVNRGEIGKGKSSHKSFSGEFYPIKNSLKTTAPVRFGEKVLRIWITPYEDSQGNYHDEGMLYTVVRPGRWQVPKEVAE